jgi:hypothetical protein
MVVDTLQIWDSLDHHPLFILEVADINPLVFFFFFFFILKKFGLF